MKKIVLAAMLWAGGARAIAPLPTISFSFTAAGMATASISVSHYRDSVIEIGLSATEYFSHGPIREWGLAVTSLPSSTPGWVVEVQVSNDDLTWTPILTHTPTVPGRSRMTWANHKPSRRARIQLTAASTGVTVTGTGYAE